MDLHLLEAFALAPDRAKALEQLIPGTEDHYFHSCLHHEQQGRFAEIDTLLRAWIQRHGDTRLNWEIRHRLALLRYPSEPAKALEHLRTHLNLRFDHQREVEGRQTKHPTALDPRWIDREAVRKFGFAHSSSDHSGFTDAALPWLADEPQPMDGNRLRQFLGRLQRPDLARLPELVLAELKDPHSGGFGSIAIHRQMLLDQLDRLAKARPELKHDRAFVYLYIEKLQPGPDVDWMHCAPERLAWLETMWIFVKPLAPVFNALRAHVLYHRLDHDRREGTYDAARFLEYVKLPRQVAYANPKYLEAFRDEERPFGLGQDFGGCTLFPAIPNDEELVRDYLGRFFRDAKDYKAYERFIEVRFLRQIFATTKILHGLGDMEQMFSLLDDPGAYQALKDRVEIEFARTNRNLFRAGEAVTLEVDVKNVPTLVVKVFEINAVNYFLANGRDVDTSMDLDGLVAGEEKTYTYDEPPARRVRRTFEFPGLARAGVFVVEFIGGGTSSRALIRKGRLHFVERVGAAGHVFAVLDEDRKPLPDASLWLSGHEFRAEQGEIRVPFSTSPGRQTILLRHGDVTTVEAFEHRSEEYEFTAGIYVDRESLLKKREAQVLVRPTLRVQGAPVPLALIEEPTLVIQSTDRDGIASSLEVPNFALHEDRESTHTFQVPENLVAITFTLRGKVQNVSQGRKVDVADARSFTLNGIDATEKIEALHLARTARGYVLSLAGKSGEPKAGTAINVSLRHRDLTRTLDFTMQTDAEGRIALGHLRDIEGFSALTPARVVERWTLPRDRCRRPAAIHAREGETIRIPWLESEPIGAVDLLDEHGKPRRPATAPERREISLLGLRAGTFVRDQFAAMKYKDGFLEIAGLPAGDFDLRIEREGTDIAIRVAPGEDRDGWVAGERRLLERGDARPLHIARVAVDAENIHIQLGHASAATRVHVLGTRFVPAHSAFDELSRAPSEGLRAVEIFRGPSQYVSGRDIGDEYRYILERRYASRHPGNLLARPGLLLNPWAVRATQTATQEAAVGARFASAGAPAPCMSMQAAMEPCAEQGEGGAFANLDFLAHPAALLLGLRPDERGVVTVPRSAVAHANQVRIVAVDAASIVSRDVLLPEVTTAHQDLRLRLALDADAHFTEKKKITALGAGLPLEIADLTTSKVEVYDTLARVYRLFATLSNDAALTTFGFVLRWPRLTPEEKRSKYSEFACHELSFFLSCKDAEFCDRVIRPYLRSKKDKTFLDRWLLGDDLASWRNPWAYGRLNVVERILLSRRFDDEGDPCARHVAELDDLSPRDLERADRLFRSAIGGSALEAGDALGIEGARNAAVSDALDREKTSVGLLAGKGGEAKEMLKKMRAAAPRKARAAADKKDMARDELSDADYNEESESDAFQAPGAGEGGRGRRDLEARQRMRPFYQRLDKTQEWAENNYWHLPIEQQGPERVVANPFWRDYAKHRFSGPFVSPHVAYAAGNFTEMMFALSVLDLPFEADAPAVEFAGARMKLTPRSRALAFHKEIMPAEREADRAPVLISQNYFRDDDRKRTVDGEEVDHYVTGEFLTDVVYACQSVLTNPTSTAQKPDLLLQIPAGSIPAKSGFVTKGMPVELGPYATRSIEYAFYFPAPGVFAHFPVHASKNERLIASAEPARMTVLREPSTVDKASWAWLSQHGEARDVLRWMEENNLDRLARPDGQGRIGLERIAWRMRERGFYEPCIALLRRRHVYLDTLWAYSVHHGDAVNVREFLLHQDGFLDLCGARLDSGLVRIDPVARRRYQHLEYAPLVNARVGKLGARRRILNDRLAVQYAALLNVLRYERTLTHDDWLAIAYYLLLQDRTEEGLAAFDRVDPARVECALQHDYLKVWTEFTRERPAAAKEIALKHRDHPVDRWRDLFRNALAQIEELSGTAARVVDDKDRDQRQGKMAATEPDFEFEVEKKTVSVRWQNLEAVRVNYYRMDIELLFSRQPFVQQQSGQFAFIRPNRSEEVNLPAGRAAFAFDLPAEFHGANVIVELTAHGKRKSQAYYAHELAVQVVENYGQVRVTRQGTGAPLPKTYVKAYARMQGGEVKFYKDGYTDLRGVFEYASLNTNELDFVERFALLVMHDAHGAVIREAGVMKR